MSGTDYWEKRDFIRLAVDSHIKFRVAGQESMESGRVLELSGGGLSFETSLELEPENEISLAIVSSSENVPPLAATAAVVRCDQIDDSDTFRVSCKIGNVSPADYGDEPE